MFTPLYTPRLRVLVILFALHATHTGGSARHRVLWDWNSNQRVLGYYWILFLYQVNVFEYFQRHSSKIFRRNFFFSFTLIKLVPKYVSEHVKEKNYLVKKIVEIVFIYFLFQSEKCFSLKSSEMYPIK